LSSFWLIIKQQWTFHPPFFLFLAWWPSWLEVWITGHNFGRGPSKDHSTKAWFKLAQWLQISSKELIKMWKVNGRTDDRRRMLSGDNSSHFLLKERNFVYFVNIHIVRLYYIWKCIAYSNSVNIFYKTVLIFQSTFGQ
jgi:hypothetical protein